ncbi:endoglucanase [Coprinopsis sp. MPI-PUGE-AT-0042]|nr:endoglucanase [Coprinopsis sp. MPI-PUGE-AT-0042]
MAAKVVFVLVNTKHACASQASVNAIRATGATQLILVEGTAWTGAWSWVYSGNAAGFLNIKDPANNFAITQNKKKLLSLHNDAPVPRLRQFVPLPPVPPPPSRALLMHLPVLWEHNLKASSARWVPAPCGEAVKGGLCSLLESGQWIGSTWWWLDQGGAI